jgi:hypothetical protein
MLMAGTVVSAMVIASGSAWLFVPEVRAFVAEMRHPGYPVGSHLDVRLPPRGVPGDVSLVLFLRSTCGVCLTSEPGLQALVAAARASRRGIAVVGFDHDQGIRGYAARLGVTGGDVIVLARDRFASLRLKAVPTVLLVDEKNVVRAEHVGLLTTERVAELTTSVR